MPNSSPIDLVLYHSMKIMTILIFTNRNGNQLSYSRFNVRLTRFYDRLSCSHILLIYSMEYLHNKKNSQLLHIWDKWYYLHLPYFYITEDSCLLVSLIYGELTGLFHFIITIIMYSFEYNVIMFDVLMVIYCFQEIRWFC